MLVYTKYGNIGLELYIDVERNYRGEYEFIKKAIFGSYPHVRPEETPIKINGKEYTGSIYYHYYHGQWRITSHSLGLTHAARLKLDEELVGILEKSPFVHFKVYMQEKEISSTTRAREQYDRTLKEIREENWAWEKWMKDNAF